MTAEIKSSNNQPLSENLLYFQNQFNTKYVFQTAYAIPHIDGNYFAKKPSYCLGKSFIKSITLIITG
ncbi:MAG: hypothetical protein A3E87_00590 [Gammaproteobacteria bacterium RIFCSPHIGHO2_12_FULL_35_23]|nr:MAG: hypothetical protein A3E87_00590 [Gammaproteobacteria bacterium RIFCSPHIGHO2_12_FULL_35_23]